MRDIGLHWRGWVTTGVAGVALAGCVAAPPNPPAATVFALPERFTALGTEPFWAAKVDGERVTYTTPENQSGRTVRVIRTATPSSVEFDGALAGKRFIMSVFEGPCSDGMSDTVYPFSVVRQLGDDVQHGCARPD